jgi:predicted transcriptional regulator
VRRQFFSLIIITGISATPIYIKMVNTIGISSINEEINCTEEILDEMRRQLIEKDKQIDKLLSLLSKQ